MVRAERIRSARSSGTIGTSPRAIHLLAADDARRRGLIVAATVAVLCSSCGARLARDNTATICSPCRRTLIENAAHLGALSARDVAAVKDAFDSLGIYGVARHLGCSPEDALDVLVNAQLLPFVSARRRQLLRQLLGLNDMSHVAAATALNISRWTVATYRRQLGTERTPDAVTSPI